MQSNNPPIIDGEFTDVDYMNLLVYVPYGSLNNYLNDPEWKKFWNIQEGETEFSEGYSKVNSIVNDEQICEVSRYNLNGRAVSKDYKGFVIIRYSDGKTRKTIQEENKDSI